MSTGAGAIRRIPAQDWRERLAPTVYGRLVQSPDLWQTMGDSGGGGSGPSRTSRSGTPDLEPNNAELDMDGGSKYDDVDDAQRGFVRPLSSTSTSHSPSFVSSLPPQTRQLAFTRGELVSRTALDIGGENSISGEIPVRRTLGARPAAQQLESNTRGVSFDPDLERIGGRTTVSVAPAVRRISPDHYKRSTSSSTKQRLKRVPEEMESTATGPVSDGHRYYGSVGQDRYPQTSSPVQEAPNSTNFDISYDEDSDLSEEEEEWLLDEELAKQGLYRGNIKNLFLLYSLVPLSAGLAFVLLALIPAFVLRNKSPSPYPYPPYLPYPLPEVFTAAALWSLSYLLRDILYESSLLVTSWTLQRLPRFIPIITSLVSAILQSAATLFFRQLAVPILLVPYYSTHPNSPPHTPHPYPNPHPQVLNAPLTAENFFGQRKHHYPTWQDDAFRRVWWIALGWAAAEAIVGIKQGYENIALYRDVLVNVRKNSGKAGLMSEAVANGGAAPASAGRIQSPVPRAMTPTRHGQGQGQMGVNLMEDVDATPTQRDVLQDRNLSAEGTIRPTNQQRAYSDSLSSLSNSRRGSQYDPLETSQGLLGGGVGGGGMGETRPLLPPLSQQNSTILRYDHDSERILAENEIERDLEQLTALKSREDLEEIYGIPFIRIPAFISCLHRINSILISLGSCLLLTSAYMRSSYSYHPPLPSPSPPPSSSSSPSPSDLLSSAAVFASTLYHPSNKALAITAPILLFIQTVLTIMHTPYVLPRIGVQTFVYVTLLVSLLLFFGGLGIWEALT